MCIAENISVSLLSLIFQIGYACFASFFPDYHCETTLSNSLMSKHVLINSIISFYSYLSYHFIDRIRQNSESQNRSALKNIRVHMGNLNHLRFQQLIASKSVEFKCATCWGLL
jgi:hypothetical protein